MSEFTDATIDRYLDRQPGMQEALLHDPVQHQQAEQLRQTLAAVERAMADEGVTDEVRRRVINRVVWGESEGRVDTHAMREQAMKMLAVRELPSGFVEQAKSWGATWETVDAAGRGDEAVVAYRWDTNQGGHRTSNIWCPECNNEFQQCGDADADLTAEDVTPGQTCDVCGRDILTGRLPEDP